MRYQVGRRERLFMVEGVRLDLSPYGPAWHHFV
jgi:hypothetical protein